MGGEVEVHEERVDQILAEYATVEHLGDDPELEAINAAIFLEEVFGLVIPEDQLDATHLGTLEAMRRVAEAQMGDS